MGCAVLATVLAFVATPALACDEPGCLIVQTTSQASETKAASAPLRLNAVTRRKIAAARNGTASASKSVISVKARKNAIKRTLRKGPAREVAHAPAVMVQVVASDELNEIDLRADEPGADEVAMAFAEEPLRPTRVTVIAVERKPRPLPPSAAVASEREQLAQVSAAPDKWIVDAWTTLQTAFSNVVTSLRRMGE
jgi:hypothetical protein